MSSRRAVSDATVLILFARAGHMSVLRRTFDDVIVPPTVRDEALPELPGRPDVLRIRDAFDDGWVRTEKPRSTQVRRLAGRHPQLDDGERDALALASDRTGWTLLTDDKRARQAAAVEGVGVYGSLGIIAQAHKDRVLSSKDAVAEVVGDILAAGLWVAPEVVERFWSRLGGRS